MGKREARFLASIFAAMCFGCASYNPYPLHWQNWFYSSPAPRSYYSSARPRHHAHVRLAHNREQTSESSLTAMRTGGDSAADHTAPVAVAPNPAATLSLAGDGGDRAHAERLLDAVDSKLARAKARTLSAPEKDEYDRASQLAKAIHVLQIREA